MQNQDQEYRERLAAKKKRIRASIDDPRPLLSTEEARVELAQHARRGMRPSETSPMKIEHFENVWDALEDTPADAAIMTMRSHLMFAIEETIKEWKVTKASAAKRLGLTQPRVTALLRRRINEFSLDELLNIAAKAGLKLKVEVTRASSPRSVKRGKSTTPNP